VATEISADSNESTRPAAASGGNPRSTRSSLQPTGVPDWSERPPGRSLSASYLHRREQVLDERIGDALGWLSLGLGLAALLAPRAICRATGLAQRPTLLRAVGVRELTSGIALLTQKRRTTWLWARVLGDAMDLTLLGAAALHPDTRRRGRALGSLAVVAPIAAIDLAASLQQSSRDNQRLAVTGGHEAFVEQVLVVNKSPRDCYDFWRDLTNLPRFIPALQSVAVQDDRTSHWVLQLPGGVKLEWDCDITADDVGERIVWHSREGAPVKHAGAIRFRPAPGGRGCTVRLIMRYEPPLGRASVGVAKLLGHDLNAESRENLRRFKQLIETGEVPTTRGQPSGRRSWLGRLTAEGRKSRAGRILRETAS